EDCRLAIELSTDDPQPAITTTGPTVIAVRRQIVVRVSGMRVIAATVAIVTALATGTARPAPAASEVVPYKDAFPDVEIVSHVIHRVYDELTVRSPTRLRQFLRSCPSSIAWSGWD